MLDLLLRRTLRYALWAVLSLTLLHSHAGTDVLTHQYDAARSGANLTEVVLNHDTVQRGNFGKQFSLRVDAAVLVPPLLATRVKMLDGEHYDVVYVASANNTLYAFDARAASPQLLWRRELTSMPSKDPVAQAGDRAIPGGILGTPVIDRTTQRLYVVAALTHADQPRFVLHALDLASGEDQVSAVVIQGAVRVDDQRVPFEPTGRRIAVQRAALSLARDRLIIAFGGDFFEGWVFSYDVADLQAEPLAYCTTCPSRVQALSGIDYLDGRCTMVGPGGGIWQSGRGPVVDDRGLIYFFTGNKQHVYRDGCAMRHSDNACSGCRTPGGCVCKGNRASSACRGHDACEAHASRDGLAFDTHDALLVLTPRLDLVAWFRPGNWNIAGVHGLEYNDLDLGGSGPALLPGVTRLVGGGKQGVMYVLDVSLRQESCVPGLRQTCIPPAPLQSFQVAPVPPAPNEYSRHILGGPVLWARASETRMYLWRVNDVLRSYRLVDGVLQDCNTTDAATTTSHTCEPVARSEDFIDHHPGGVLTLSAHGDDARSGIVWAAKQQSMSEPASLMAFNALPSAAAPGRLEKIWSSAWCEGDALEAGAEFTPPVVANGRVFLATGAGTVEVFGPLPGRECLPQPERVNLGPLLQ